MPRSLLAVVAAAVAALISAAPAQAAPTLAFDKPCYSQGDEVKFSGTGYTPGGAVQLIFRSFGTEQIGSYDAEADAGGAIAGSLATPDEDLYIKDDAFADMIGVAANDRVRIEAGAAQEEQFAGAVFEFSRYEVEVEQPNGRRPKAARPMRITAVGFTNAIGETLYVHYRRGGRTVKTIKLGRLTGDCGDRSRTLPRALPRGLRPGTYKLVFNTSKRDPRSTPNYWHKLRLR
jgi:hypothetical protein